ncbi:MAG TPA: PAS domain S-box protein [Syntrophobacteraceae bacterium]|nr:PAS domain S-box protein [Syntrophobacteraceae bacterium]
MAEHSPHHPPPRSEALLWDILESVTDAIVTIDEDHKVVLCNRAAEKMFGYLPEEMIGQDVSPLIPSSHRVLHKGYVERYLATGVPRVIGMLRECHAQRKNGESFPVEISYSVSRSGERTYFTAVIRDISQRKQMERDIHFMERLVDIGKAVSQITHEIRKPLMLIGGFAHQLRSCDGLQADEKSRRKLDIILKEVQRLESLLNGIRLATRPGTSGRKQLLSVRKLLEETFELFESTLRETRIRFTAELDPDPLMVEGDSDQLKQVFLNMMQNAVEAMNGVGTLTVGTRIGDGTIQVLIRDSGPGIPVEIRERIFDPFFTTKTEGTGLGLAISRNIVQDHGGAISVESSSRGTTFLLQLPPGFP